MHGWYSARDVANLLGITKQRVHQYYRDGRLPAEKFVGVLHFRRSIVDKFHAQRKRKPVPA